MRVFTCCDDFLLIDPECTSLLAHAFRDAGVGFWAVHKIEAEVVILAFADDMKAIAVAVARLRKVAGTQLHPILWGAFRREWQNYSWRKDADKERSQGHHLRVGWRYFDCILKTPSQSALGGFAFKVRVRSSITREGVEGESRFFSGRFGSRLADS